MANSTRLREFTWAGMTFGHLVPTGGFSWRVDLVRNHEQPGSPLPGNERGPWLTAAGYYGPHYGGEEYRLDAPLRRSRSDIGLHRDFASLSPVAILAFANQYGPLGHGEMLVDPAGSFEQDSPYGESFEFWRRQIQKMAALVRTWDLARREETRILTHLVKWTRPGERAVGPVRVEVTIPPWEPWWTEAPVPWRFDSILDPVRAIVALHLNEVLRETTAPQVLMPEGKPTCRTFPSHSSGRSMCPSPTSSPASPMPPSSVQTGGTRAAGSTTSTAGSSPRRPSRVTAATRAGILSGVGRRRGSQTAPTTILLESEAPLLVELSYGPSRTRTCDRPIMSRQL